LQDAIGYGIMIANGCRFGLAGFFDKLKKTLPRFRFWLPDGWNRGEF